MFMCLLPFRLRRLTLPQLLDRTGSASPRWPATRLPEPGRIVSIVSRVCRLAVFRLPIFPRDCLRHALALHHILTPAAGDICLQIGVRKENGRLVAHSWVTRRHDATFAPGALPGFRTLYCHQPDGR
jgi:hypothetical protein